MTDAARALYRYWMLLLLLALVVQVAAAAFGAFDAANELNNQSGPDSSRMISEETFENGFDFHIGFGYLIFLASVVLLLLALGARVGRPRIWWNLAVPVLVVVQIALFAWGGEDHPVLGALHGVNALLIVGLVGSLVYQQWRRQAVEADIAAGGAGVARR